MVCAVAFIPSRRYNDGGSDQDRLNGSTGRGDMKRYGQGARVTPLWFRSNQQISGRTAARAGGRSTSATPRHAPW